MAKTEDLSFSAREMEVLALAWQCFESEPKVNMTKLADLAGYTKGSASVTFGNIKRKLRLLGGGTGTGDTGTPTPTATPKKASAPKTPKTPKSDSKRAASAANDDTPSKKKKLTPSKSARDDFDDEDEFRNIGVKKEEIDGLLAGADSFYTQGGGFGSFGGLVGSFPNGMGEDDAL